MIIRRSLRVADLGAVCTVLQDDFIVLAAVQTPQGWTPQIVTDTSSLDEARTGRPAAALLTEENWEALRHACEQAAIARSPAGFAAQHRAAGSVRVLDALCIPIFDDDHSEECAYFVCTARDIASDYFRLVANTDVMPGIAGELAAALTRNEFELHYQPVFEVRTGRMVGAEALIRWNHPRRGQLRADAFLRSAEKAGLLNEIGEWAIWEACATAAEWNRNRTRPIGLTVNVSPVEITSGMALRVITAALAASGLDPALLTVDVPAPVLATDRGDLPALLAHLAAIGVSVAIDDFGLSYRALLAIRALSGRTIKIDRSMIEGIDKNPAALDALHDLVTAHRPLDLIFAAEGVESQAELDVVRRLGFDLVQGLGRAAPMSVEAFGEFIVTSDELPLH